MSKITDIPFDSLNLVLNYLNEAEISMLIFVNTDFYYLVKDKKRVYNYSCLYNVNLIDFFNLDRKKLNLERLSYYNQTDCVKSKINYEKYYGNFNFSEILKKQKILDNIYIYDNLECFKCLEEWIDKKDKNICTDVIKKDAIKIIKYLKFNNYFFDENLCTMAINNGSLKCFLFLLNKDYIFDKQTCIIAAHKGYLKIIKFLLRNNIFEYDELLPRYGQEDVNWDTLICKTACENGYLGCLKYILKKSKSICKEATNAIKYKNIDCFKYLVENNHYIDEYTFNVVLKNGDLDCLKLLEEKNCPFFDNIYTTALISGNLNCCYYLKENGYLVKPELCNSIIINSNLDCLKYAIEHGYYFDHSSLSITIVNNKLDCFKYLLNLNCKPSKHDLFIMIESNKIKYINHLISLGYCDDNEIFNTAFFGGYEASKFIAEYYDHLIDEDFSIRYSERLITTKSFFPCKKLCTILSKKGYFHIFELLKYRDVFRPSIYTRFKDTHFTRIATHYGSIDVLKYCFEKGYKHRKLCNYASSAGHTECLKFLIGQGCRIHRKTVFLAALKGHLNCLKVLSKQNVQKEEIAPWSALLNNHLDCFKFLVENGWPFPKDIYKLMISKENFNCDDYLPFM